MGETGMLRSHLVRRRMRNRERSQNADCYDCDRTQNPTVTGHPGLRRWHQLSWKTLFLLSDRSYIRIHSHTHTRI
jgi:hypothetical protein